ncbi:hypothetical protein A2U01_0056378 [Trifolium medium]|uniref:Uncharacterized protein n=1 Tax=Trifolium medium TaxID=97028 RepID=A0A392RG16_9FABA|nr:hypothetical protein [Trifolium medium]
MLNRLAETLMKYTLAKRALQRAKAIVYVLELSLSESERPVARHSLFLARRMKMFYCRSPILARPR